MPNPLRQVSLHRRRSAQGRPQNLPDLFLHRTSVVGGSDPQAAFNVLIKLPNGYGGHAINDSTDGNDCAILVSRQAEDVLLAGHAAQFFKKHRVRDPRCIRPQN